MNPYLGRGIYQKGSLECRFEDTRVFISQVQGQDQSQGRGGEWIQGSDGNGRDRSGG